VVSADQVLFGTNGYSDQLIPGLRESIVPVVSIQAATNPLTAEQDAQILQQGHTFSDTRRVIFYFRKTADNRLVFGSAGTAGETPGISERNRILNGLATVFPQFPDLDLDYIWGGQIAVTQDHLPHIHQPGPGLHVGLGCNGRGVALSTVMGRLLAQTVLGQSPADLPIPVCPIKKYPFYQFHKTGIKIAVAWKEFQDRREANL
jgi:glycine/D-amino acid oxidase-like deaminating enzyme